MVEVQGSRVLVVGDDAAERERLASLLTEAGCPALAAERPEGTFDLLLAHGPQALLRSHVARQGAGQLRVATVIYLPEDAAGVFLPSDLAGTADEVIPVPVSDADLCRRLQELLRTRTPRTSLEHLERQRDMLGEIGQILASGLDIIEILQECVTRVTEMMGADRGSLLILGDTEVMHVMAASDDPSVCKLPLLLEKYPEVRAARESREVCVVEDAPHSPLLGPFAQAVAARGIGSLVCLPLCDGRQANAVILLRFAEERLPDQTPLACGRVAAGMIALGLRGTDIFERVREQTRRLSLAKYTAERRLRALEKYREFLESSTDAMFVTDAEGIVLYVNLAAEQLTGFAREALCERPVLDLVAEPQRPPLAEAVRHVATGTNLQNFDLDLLTTSGDPLIVSCATSSVLSDQGAAILSFRDVTEARALQNQLGQTKDFLERLIDSTVDGIVAADTSGNIILFNKGAERVTGWKAEEVIGKLHIEQLYQPGIARAIMRELRSGTQGAVGRLELSRRDVLARDGTPIPVNMTASIVYDEGREVATVGVFSDLRERLRIEERLRQAQEKLVLSEKQALIAELAGTTAHELNQPLTSVMGCIELLDRRMGPDNPHKHLLETVTREAERMADIVRKIGKITRYETKAYVGSTQILDLDKATE
ncbi:MAG: PAS domain S-box protein [Deltaproteobacteria bacterium]|nr:PAS domain S-box protein [Deltaproteobacteria bacterium]